MAGWGGVVWEGEWDGGKSLSFGDLREPYNVKNRQVFYWLENSFTPKKHVFFFYCVGGCGVGWCGVGWCVVVCGGVAVWRCGGEVMCVVWWCDDVTTWWSGGVVVCGCVGVKVRWWHRRWLRLRQQRQ